MVKRVNQLDVLKGSWASHVRAQGDVALRPEVVAKRNYLVVDDLIKLKKKQWALIQQVFTDKQDLDKFKLCLKEAFEGILNKDSNQTAEFLAKFLDYHMKRVQSVIDDAELEELIEEVIFLFRYAKSKDVFEEFYLRGLCRRLLLKKSASLDGERALLQKLKVECGDHFTQKVEGMLKDLTMSNQFMQKYRDDKARAQQEEIKEDVDTHFYVLSQSNWPI